MILVSVEVALTLENLYTTYPVTEMVVCLI
jgi:hypothetical protein